MLLYFNNNTVSDIQMIIIFTSIVHMSTTVI